MTYVCCKMMLPGAHIHLSKCVEVHDMELFLHYTHVKLKFYVSISQRVNYTGAYFGWVYNYLDRVKPFQPWFSSEI